MVTPFKMKGFSGFGNSPTKQKTHPVTPPTKEQSKKSKGELFERDLTGFRRYDRVGTKEEQRQKRIDDAKLAREIQTKKFLSNPTHQRAAQLDSKIRNISDKITKATKSSKKKEAKSGSIGRKI